MTDTAFWWFVREREAIRLRRAAGAAPPYTEDPRLRDYRFPNIRRLDDPSTAWFHREVLSRLNDPEQISMAALVFRLFSNVETAKALRPLFFEGYSERRLLVLAAPLRRPFSPARQLTKIRTLADVARACETFNGTLWPRLRGAGMRDATEALMLAPGLGRELAYEIACDLRRTSVLAGARDVHSWALPGASATEVAGAFLGREMSATRQQDCDDTVGLMRALHKDSRSEWPIWEMSEIHRGLTLFHYWAREPNPRRRFRWK